MKISPFTPLHFGEANASDGLPSRYVQLFAPTDRIMIQVIADAEDLAPDATISDAHTGASVGSITWQTWEMNENKKLFFATLCGMSVGHYTIRIYDNFKQSLDVVSDEFRITDDAIALSKTTLIQYRFKDNKQRDDVVSVIDFMTYFFDFRVPGGFKDSGWQFGVSNEQFTTQREDLVELFANDYTSKTFTLGGALGVPVWYGEMLNRLLCCSYVYFNGDRYVRNESEVPTINVLVDGLDSFVFTQILRKAQVIDPLIEELNQISIRRVIGNDNDAPFDTNRTTLSNLNEEDNYVLIP